MQLKHTITAVVALALFASPVASAAVSNYVDNGGFEDFDGDVPDDWRADGNGDVSPTSTSTEGTTAAHLTVEDVHQSFHIAQNISLPNEDPPTPSGTEYNLTFDAKLGTGAETDPTEEATAEATVLWKDALGQVVEIDTVSIDQSSSYVSYQETLQAPLPDPGELPVTEAELQFELTSGDRSDVDLFVDDVGFELATPVS